MPERRNRRSETGKPAGSMIAASTPRHAQVRIIAPALAAMSGWYSARAIGAEDMAAALVVKPRDCHPADRPRASVRESSEAASAPKSRPRARRGGWREVDGAPRGRRRNRAAAAMDNARERCD